MILEIKHIQNWNNVFIQSLIIRNKRSVDVRFNRIKLIG